MLVDHKAEMDLRQNLVELQEKGQQDQVTLSASTKVGKYVRSDAFIMGEELGTTVNPKCGACRCGKCPLTGHTYSFVEQ